MNANIQLYDLLSGSVSVHDMVRYGATGALVTIGGGAGVAVTLRFDGDPDVEDPLVQFQKFINQLQRAHDLAVSIRVADANDDVDPVEEAMDDAEREALWKALWNMQKQAIANLDDEQEPF